MKLLVFLSTLVVCAFCGLLVFGQSNIKVYANPSLSAALVKTQATKDSNGNTLILFPRRISHSLLDAARVYSIATAKFRNRRYCEVEGSMAGSSGIYSTYDLNLSNYPGDTSLNTLTYVKALGAALRVEAGTPLLGKPLAAQSWCFLVCVAMQLSSHVQSSIPHTSSGFSHQIITTQLNTQVIPHVQYTSERRIGLDINFPFTLASANKVFRYTNNPSIPLAQRRSEELRFAASVYEFTVPVRVGISYRL
jgi:hypothetical protein